MGNPREQTDLMFIGEFYESLGWILFKKTVNNLSALYLALLDGVFAFFLPTYVWSDGDTEITNLSFKLQLLQCLEQFIFLEVC